MSIFKHPIAKALALVLVAALTRLIPHPPNFTSVTAVALFSGAVLGRRNWGLGVLWALLPLFVSDLFLGFHALVPFTYGAFTLISLGLGRFYLGRSASLHWSKVAVASLSASFLFFVVSNFGVWAMSTDGFYAKTPAGLLECYTAALPFFERSLAGDAFYAALLFGAYSLWTEGNLRRVNIGSPAASA